MCDKLKYTAKMFAAGAVMLGASLFSSPTTAQTINISGQITNAETGAPIQGAKEVLINPTTNARLDSTYTDVNGHYNMTYNWVGLQENQNITIDKLFPNPYTSETKINMLLNKDKEYKIMAFDNQGRILFEKSQFLTKGAYEFSISGGQAGINFITITDGAAAKTYKGLQTTSTSAPINISVNQMFTTPQLKSTLDEILTEGDPAKLESSAPGYYTTDTTWALQLNNTINQTIEKIPTTYNFNAVALNHLDTATQNVVINVEWSDGVTTTHYGQNGIININRTTTADLTDTIFITNADTTLYSPLMWAQQDSTLALFRLPYGIDLLPPIRNENVDNPLTNARYQAAEDRDFFDQCIFTQYNNNLGTPGGYGIIPTYLTVIFHSLGTA